MAHCANRSARGCVVTAREVSGPPRAMTSAVSTAAEALELARLLDARAAEVVAASDAWEREQAKGPAERDKSVGTTWRHAVHQWRAARAAATMAGVP